VSATTCSVASCVRPVRKRGLCHGHNVSMGRAPIVDKYSPIMDRLHLKSVLVPMCGCRVWFGASVPAGYGVIAHNGKQTYTHRVAWELAHGEIPPGMLVMHRCDTPACINVDHLQLGTPLDNMHDMLRKGRHKYKAHFGDDNPQRKYPGLVSGEKNGHAKLLRSEVELIRSLYTTGETQKALAKRFGVSQGAVSAYVLRKTYK